ncbi:hypothetical protein BDN71DRAFT_1552207 [Pleurotus eryngii]|uniref:Uncharacterized protein n=1 Tax=Pleurotus eryngii TaxID=5323 RepID=A0A9P6A1J7_PLEER|nr:hypothetical protein BDN71DRAFT_1552207 [Pleurotus eryngii]
MPRVLDDLLDKIDIPPPGLQANHFPVAHAANDWYSSFQMNMESNQDIMMEGPEGNLQRDKEGQAQDVQMGNEEQAQNDEMGGEELLQDQWRNEEDHNRPQSGPTYQKQGAGPQAELYGRIQGLVNEMWVDHQILVQQMSIGFERMADLIQQVLEHCVAEETSIPSG